MRTLVFAAVIAGVVWIGMAPANAAPPSMSGIDNPNIKVGTVKNIGYWRRYYRRYGYPAASGANVCFWHKADMLNALTNVRFWEQTGH